MVTKSEQQVIDKYKEEGYNYTHVGAPDFLFFKLKGNQGLTKSLKDIDINSIEFVEVKYNGNTLSHEQQIWRHILKALGLKYKLIHIQSKKLDSDQTK